MSGGLMEDTGEANDIERTGAKVDAEKMRQLREILGEELLRKRKSGRLSRQRVSDDTGIPVSTILEIEKGKVEAKIRTLNRLAFYYRMTLAELFACLDPLCVTAPQGKHGSLQRQYWLIDRIAADVLKNPDVHGL